MSIQDHRQVYPVYIIICFIVANLGIWMNFHHIKMLTTMMTVVGIIFMIKYLNYIKENI